jgi:hypothetical protein
MNFLDRFSKNVPMQNFTKILPVKAELFHADGQTDRHDAAISRFPNFANAPKTQTLIPGIRNNSARLWTFIRWWLLCVPPALSWNNSRTTVTIQVYICNYGHNQANVCQFLIRCSIIKLTSVKKKPACLTPVATVIFVIRLSTYPG